MTKMQNKKENLIVDPTRLNILCLLLDVEYADFTFLKKELMLTQGNLSFHLTKLEKNEIVNSKKKFINKMPVTTYALTVAGKALLREYLDRMYKIAKKYQ